MMIINLIRKLNNSPYCGVIWVNLACTVYSLIPLLFFLVGLNGFIAKYVGVLLLSLLSVAAYFVGKD